MRLVSPLLLSVLMTACATQETVPAKPVDAPKPAQKAPQCWSGDESKFFDVGQKAKVAGIDVTCTATTDGKNAQWMGAQHKK